MLFRITPGEKIVRKLPLPQSRTGDLALRQPVYARDRDSMARIIDPKATVFPKTPSQENRSCAGTSFPSLLLLLE